MIEELRLWISLAALVISAVALGWTVFMFLAQRSKATKEQIHALRGRHRRIWYLTDGIYSMFGHTAPLKQLGVLVDRYEELNLYIDDAHGMSWTGKNGRTGVARISSP